MHWTKPTLSTKLPRRSVSLVVSRGMCYLAVLWGLEGRYSVSLPSRKVTVSNQELYILCRDSLTFALHCEWSGFLREFRMMTMCISQGY